MPTGKNVYDLLSINDYEQRVKCSPLLSVKKEEKTSKRCFFSLLPLFVYFGIIKFDHTNFPV